MSELLDFEQGKSRRWVKRAMQSFDDLNARADENISEFHKLMLQDPTSAISAFTTFVQQGRDINQLPDAMIGGPNHDWIAPLIDVGGSVYPELPVGERTRFLEMVMNYLSSLNSFYSQNHVELINEPWLVADILVNSDWMYWPGFIQQSGMLEKYPTWEALYPHLGEVKSAFFMALAVSKPKYSTDQIRRNFYQTFPSLTDRTQDAIAALIYVRAQNAFLKEGIPIHEYVESKLFGYDPEIAPNILRKIKEKKWIDLNRSIYFKDPKTGLFQYRKRSEIPAEAGM